MPNRKFGSMTAKLIMTGFKDIGMVDHEENTLAACDRNGSERLIVDHPTSRKFLRQTCDHGSDH